MSHSRPREFLLMRAILRSDLNSGQVRILLVITDFAGWGRRACTASYQTIAEESGVCRRHVIRIVKELANAGWITVEPLGDGKGENAIRLAPKLLAVVGESAEGRSDRPRASRPRRPASDSHVTSASDSGVTGGGDIFDTASDSHVTSASDSGVTQTAYLNGERTAPSNEKAGDGGISSPPGEGIPDETLEAIAEALGPSLATEAAKSASQLHRACGGDWKVLEAAARQAKRGDRPFGLMVSKAKEFAANGIPPEARPRRDPPIEFYRAGMPHPGLRPVPPRPPAPPLVFTTAPPDWRPRPAPPTGVGGQPVGSMNDTPVKQAGIRPSSSDPASATRKEPA